MSDENVTHKEDKENLMYIYRQIKLKRFQQDEAPSVKDSTSSASSILPIGCFESDLSLHSIIGKQVGPEVFNSPEIIAKTKPFVNIF